jgi:hydrogenase maturation factor
VTVCDHTSGCITCGDEAAELTVVQIDEKQGLALCRDDSGQTESVEIALVRPVHQGDSLLVHAGTAIQIASRA